VPRGVCAGASEDAVLKRGQGANSTKTMPVIQTIRRRLASRPVSSRQCRRYVPRHCSFPAHFGLAFPRDLTSPRVDWPRVGASANHPVKTDASASTTHLNISSGGLLLQVVRRRSLRNRRRVAVANHADGDRRCSWSVSITNAIPRGCERLAGASERRCGRRVAVVNASTSGLHTDRRRLH